MGGKPLRTASALACAALGAAASPAAAYVVTYPDVHGHTITVVGGGTVPNAERDRMFIDALGSLTHGDEMSQLTLDLTTSDTAHIEECRGAEACYSYGSQPGRIHIRGFDTGASLTDEDDNAPLTQNTLPRSLLAHEYGHHVANHRLNDGGDGSTANVNGTKRWASYMRICPRISKGRLAHRRWPLSPGEGFAESYAAIHFPELIDTWRLDSVLRPDATALALIREDVLDPYPGPRSKRLRGAFSRRGRERRVKTLRTPLDGRLTASLATTGSLKAKLDLRHSHKRVARYRGARQRLVYDVCGARRLQLTVKRVSGAGTFTVRVSRP